MFKSAILVINDTIDVEMMKAFGKKKIWEWVAVSVEEMILIIKSKLSSVNNSAPYNNADLPAGVKNPQVALASDPIPAGDIAFIIHAAKGAHSSLSAFHVKPREALVVQFESS
ncbi:hypothetical protein P5673_031145 [Acropora cervicornis]|uniref:Uncharacterized protein n=1 Tax=Acropora cervicornis TaxID=6130 RepID=A0AAD9PT67_ACRCE|nr:hypothetical protein P5673_031145 [Acropora cervicornis]